MANLAKPYGGERPAMGHAERLRAELNALYKAADSPTLATMAGVGAKQLPPVKISLSSVSGWLKGPAVPSTGEATRYFLALVHYLQSKAQKAGSDHTPRPPQYWETLLVQARKERDAARGGRPPKDPADHVPVPAPMTLPLAPAGFTGRTDEIDQVLWWLQPLDGAGEPSEEAATVVVSAVSGMGGVGKTALALHATQARDRGWFPGGTLFADLRGYGDEPVGAAETADRMLRALGVKGRDMPPTPDGKTDAWRQKLAELAAQGQPLLVVLDNVRDPAQASALLPGTPHRALLTSRHRLSAMPVRRIELNPLSAADAAALLDRALRAGGTQDDRVTTQPEAALEIVQLCGFLPLALRIIGALLRDERGRPLAAQARELADERMRLDVLEYEGKEADWRPLAVRASFELSYRHLAQDARRVFRLLGAAPGADVSTTSAAKLFDRGLAQARRLLAGLARAHLVVKTAESGAELTFAVCGLLQERRHLEDWITLSRSSVAISHERDDLPVEAKALGNLGAALSEMGRIEEVIDVTERTAEIHHQLGDLAGEGLARLNLGGALAEAGRCGEAVEAGQAALQIHRTLKDRHMEARVLSNLGIAWAGLGRFDEAIDADKKAAAAHRETDYPRGEGMALTNLGSALASTGRFAEALEAHTQALAIHRATGDRHLEGKAGNALGCALVGSERPEEAVDAHTEAAAIFRETGELALRAMAMDDLGVALQATGRSQEAADAHAQAAAIFREAGDRHAEARTLCNQGFVLQEAGRSAQADIAYQRAADLFRDRRPRRASPRPGRQTKRRAVALSSDAAAPRWLAAGAVQPQEPVSVRPPRADAKAAVSRHLRRRLGRQGHA
ncbi:tetratricopeptide repeat protein [Streptomyces sp. NPDC059092]|uniref:tetratricopeptide repeat protein n=1 Tax=Streptomyces sp. NPDC059092 TaxID=3346725 RepID=UPI0036CCF565